MMKPPSKKIRIEKPKISVFRSAVELKTISLFFRDEHKEAADLLLIYGLTHIEPFDLRFITGFDDFDFDLDITRIFIGKSEDIE